MLLFAAVAVAKALQLDGGLLLDCFGGYFGGYFGYFGITIYCNSAHYYMTHELLFNRISLQMIN